ncbi:unnamed protein product [Paramecium primaurelia]|uniref:Uncharacterized protein n=2 Tax=Paramecium TaxID=5884 RepID=A0A8S1TRE3_9CILI|nr:unnamed protein product [Paramecium primaurelia]CAD8154464.1 unnamed protein product [Paramecium pentaurelia]
MTTAFRRISSIKMEYKRRERFKMMFLNNWRKLL